MCGTTLQCFILKLMITGINPLPPIFHWHPICNPWISSFCITWGFVRNAGFQAPAQTCQLRIYVLRRPPGIVWTLKSEMHCFIFHFWNRITCLYYTFGLGNFLLNNNKKQIIADNIGNECLLFARHYPKSFIWNTCFNLCNNPLEEETLLVPFTENRSEAYSG